MADTLIRLELHTKTKHRQNVLPSNKRAWGHASADATAIKVENRVFLSTLLTLALLQFLTLHPLPSFGHTQPANHEQEPGGNAFQG